MDFVEIVLLDCTYSFKIVLYSECTNREKPICQRVSFLTLLLRHGSVSKILDEDNEEVNSPVLTCTFHRSERG